MNESPNDRIDGVTTVSDHWDKVIALKGQPIERTPAPGHFFIDTCVADAFMENEPVYDMRLFLRTHKKRNNNTPTPKRAHGK